MNTIKQLRKVLLQCRPLAIVGLAFRWYRPIFFAAKYLQAHSYPVVPVNQLYGKASMLVGDPAWCVRRDSNKRSFVCHGYKWLDSQFG